MNDILKVLVFSLFLFLSGCTPDLTDDSGFTLHYYDIAEVYPGNTANTYPSYIGGTPTDFQVYLIHHHDKIYWHPKLDKPLEEIGIFYMDPNTGFFSVLKSNTLKPGTYTVSFTCKVDGTIHDFPRKISIEVIEKR